MLLWARVRSAPFPDDGKHTANHLLCLGLANAGSCLVICPYTSQKILCITLGLCVRLACENFVNFIASMPCMRRSSPENVVERSTSSFSEIEGSSIYSYERLCQGCSPKANSRSPSQVIESNFSFNRSSIISSPVLPTAFLELLAATARARVVTPDVLEHLLLFGFRNTLFSRLNRSSDFFTEFLRQFFK